MFAHFVIGAGVALPDVTDFVEGDTQVCHSFFSSWMDMRPPPPKEESKLLLFSSTRARGWGGGRAVSQRRLPPCNSTLPPCGECCDVADGWGIEWLKAVTVKTP